MRTGEIGRSPSWETANRRRSKPTKPIPLWRSLNSITKVDTRSSTEIYTSSPREHTAMRRRRLISLSVRISKISDQQRVDLRWRWSSRIGRVEVFPSKPSTRAESRTSWRTCRQGRLGCSPRLMDNTSLHVKLIGSTNSWIWTTGNIIWLGKGVIRASWRKFLSLSPRTAAAVVVVVAAVAVILIIKRKNVGWKWFFGIWLKFSRSYYFTSYSNYWRLIQLTYFLPQLFKIFVIWFIMTHSVHQEATTKYRIFFGFYHWGCNSNFCTICLWKQAAMAIIFYFNL